MEKRLFSKSIMQPFLTRKSNPRTTGRTNPLITLAFTTNFRPAMEKGSLKSPIVTTSLPLMLWPTSVWGLNIHSWRNGDFWICISETQVVEQPVSTRQTVVLSPNFISISARISGLGSWVRWAFGFELPTLSWLSGVPVPINPPAHGWHNGQSTGHGKETGQNNGQRNSAPQH